MRHRILERAAAAGVALSLVVAAAAFADTVRGDADTVTAGIQGSRDLGTVAPGAVIDVPVAFELRCANLQHLDPGQSVVVTIGDSTVPTGGAVAMAPVTLGPVPSTWPKDGDGCAGTETPIGGLGTVTVTAPQAAGSYEYTLLFSRTPSPAGSNDDGAFGGSDGGGLHPHRRRAREHAARPRPAGRHDRRGRRARRLDAPPTRSPPPTPRTTRTRCPRARRPSGRCFRSGRRRSPARSPTRAGSSTTGSFDVTVNAAAAPPAPEPEPVPESR